MAFQCACNAILRSPSTIADATFVPKGEDGGVDIDSNVDVNVDVNVDDDVEEAVEEAAATQAGEDSKCFVKYALFVNSFEHAAQL